MEEAKVNKKSVVLQLGEKEELKVEKVMVAIGRHQMLTELAYKTLQ